MPPVERHFPERFGDGPGADELLFRWADGSHLTTLDVKMLLVRAAAEEGFAKEDLGSHSLRFGGASALCVPGM